MFPGGSSNSQACLANPPGAYQGEQPTFGVAEQPGYARQRANGVLQRLELSNGARQWLRTGDRYFRDAQGYYWYLGRVNDVFKVSGQWVHPMEVERCLASHPAVRECVVKETSPDALRTS